MKQHSLRDQGYDDDEGTIYDSQYTACQPN